MNPTSFAPAILSILLALAFCYLAKSRIGLPNSESRQLPIDGLRGYLAFFVFLHHSSIWYFYLHDNTWKNPPSALYFDLGFCSVSAFFMITGFLFFKKVLDSDQNPIDWTRLYSSRVARLVPLYLFVVAFVAIIIGFKSNWALANPTERIVLDISKWLAFTIPGAPDINGVSHTWLITAGVTWTLPHEWKFYASLPFFALLFRKKVPAVLMVSGIVIFALWHPNGTVLTSFFSGMLAAIFSKKEWFKKFASSQSASYVALFSQSLLFIVPVENSDWYIPIIGIAFALIANGCDFFGILNWSSSRVLGEISYSIYLLHGVFLYIVHNFLFGAGIEVSLSPVQYWLLNVSYVPILLGLCSLTFVFIERPGIALTPKLTAFAKSLFRS
jgi:peptidoglycan/LPS O-acetylase OafA/YrhL